MTDQNQSSLNLDLVPVREPYAHGIHQDFTAETNFEILRYERLFLDMSVDNNMEFEACPFQIQGADQSGGIWRYDLTGPGYQIDLTCRPVLKSVQTPDCNPIAILSPYTNTFPEAVCWAAWMEVKGIDGKSTEPKNGFLFSVGLFEKGLEQYGLEGVSKSAIQGAIGELHEFLKGQYSEKEVIRPADMAQGIRYLLSRLDQGERASDIREVLVGQFNISCRLSLRDTCDQYARAGVSEKACMDQISHMAIYPDGRVVFLTDLEYTTIVDEG
jgi:hypothetical protein